MTLVTLFLLAGALSLGASAVLVTCLERLGLTEAMLGLLAALAADAPEVSTAVTALVRGQRTVSVGVILGRTPSTWRRSSGWRRSSPAGSGFTAGS